MPNNNNQQSSNTRVELVDRKRLIVNGVTSVDGFSEEFLRLSLNGEKLNVTGNGIKITAYAKSSGNLQAEGNFESFKFSDKKAPILKRFFK